MTTIQKTKSQAEVWFEKRQRAKEEAKQILATVTQELKQSAALMYSEDHSDERSDRDAAQAERDRRFGDEIAEDQNVYVFPDGSVYWELDGEPCKYHYDNRRLATSVYDEPQPFLDVFDGFLLNERSDARNEDAPPLTDLFEALMTNSNFTPATALKTVLDNIKLINESETVEEVIEELARANAASK